jgi:hypothetical protein
VYHRNVRLQRPAVTGPVDGQDALAGQRRWQPKRAAALRVNQWKRSIPAPAADIEASQPPGGGQPVEHRLPAPPTEHHHRARRHRHHPGTELMVGEQQRRHKQRCAADDEL